MATPEEEFTIMLRRAKVPSDLQARDDFYKLVEQELRHLAHSLRRHQGPDHTLQTTLLVDEAFLRMVNTVGYGGADSSEFFRLAHGTMRRILSNHNRRRRPSPLGAERAGMLADGKSPTPDRRLEGEEDLLAISTALSNLEQHNKAAADAFMLCFFHSVAGKTPALTLQLLKDIPADQLSTREIAEIQGTSKATAHRLVGRALCFLQDELQQLQP